MSQQVGSYTDVYIWRARDENGYITTSSEGWRNDGNRNNPGRVGHASIYVAKVGEKEKTYGYASLWPSGGKHENLRAKITVIKDSRLNTFEQDKDQEEGKPDVIIRLFHLNVDKMLEAIEIIIKRDENKDLYWTAKASDTDDAINPNCKKASCVSLVWSILRRGGIDEKDGFYANAMSNKGPKDKAFFNLLKCNLGQRAAGRFNGWFWTNKIFTPYALCLRVGSAAEADEDYDKKETMNLMRSNNVAPIPNGNPIEEPVAAANQRVAAVQDVAVEPVPDSSESTWSNAAIIAGSTVTAVGVAWIATFIFRNTR